LRAACARRPLREEELIAKDAARITQGISGQRWINHLLVDGMLRGSWWVDNDRKRQSLLTVRPFKPFSAAERRAVADEAEQLLAVAGGHAELRDVRFETP
jgi:hypothetical protein